MTRINKSWREQAKPIIATSQDGKVFKFRSLWEAATEISDLVECKFDTARKEIRKALQTEARRYDLSWEYEADNTIRKERTETCSS